MLAHIHSKFGETQGVGDPLATSRYFWPYLWKMRACKRPLVVIETPKMESKKVNKGLGYGCFWLFLSPAHTLHKREHVTWGMSSFYARQEGKCPPLWYSKWYRKYRINVHRWRFVCVPSNLVGSDVNDPFVQFMFQIWF